MTINKKDLELAIKNVVNADKPEKERPQRQLPAGKIKFGVLEKRALDDFIAKGLPDIDLYPKEQMLEAFLAGADINEIAQMFPNYQVGGVAYLKASEGWGSLRKEYLDELQYKSTLKLLQTKSQAVSSMSLIISSFHKDIQPKILQYLQTGDPEALPTKFGIKNFDDYRRFIDLLSKISKLSPGEAISTESPANITIQADNINIGGDDNRQVNTGSAVSSEKLQGAAFDILKGLYDRKG